MKKLSGNFTTIRNAFLASFILLSFVSASLATAGSKDEGKEDKTTVKMRESVANASPDDWHTFAEAAEKCIMKGVNLKEASEWLDKSLSIRECSYNLVVKGDYYKVNRLPEQALAYYVKALQAGKTENPDFDPSAIQKKIAEIHFQK